MKKVVLFFILIIGIFINLSSCKKDSAEMIVHHDGVDYDLLTGFSLNIHPRKFLDKRDFSVYSVVGIHNQTWMGENLRYNSSESWGGGIGIGRRYSHESALNACPDRWHLPNKDELERLAYHAGGGNLSTAGTALKSADKWNGTNSARFNALPSSYGYWSSTSRQYITGPPSCSWCSPPHYYASIYMKLSDSPAAVFTHTPNDAVAQHCRCILD